MSRGRWVKQKPTFYPEWEKSFGKYLGRLRQTLSYSEYHTTEYQYFYKVWIKGFSFEGGFPEDNLLPAKREATKRIKDAIHRLEKELK